MDATLTYLSCNLHLILAYASKIPHVTRIQPSRNPLTTLIVSSPSVPLRLKLCLMIPHISSFVSNETACLTKFGAFLRTSRRAHHRVCGSAYRLLPLQLQPGDSTEDSIEFAKQTVTDQKKQYNSTVWNLKSDFASRTAVMPQPLGAPGGPGPPPSSLRVELSPLPAAAPGGTVVSTAPWPHFAFSLGFIKILMTSIFLFSFLLMRFAFSVL